MQYLPVPCPIPGKKYQEYEKNKNLIYLINIKDSLLSGNDFFHYLSSTTLPIEITFDLDIEYTVFDNLIFTYMTTNHIVDSITLRDIVSTIILTYLQIDHPFNKDLSPLYIHTFINRHTDLVSLWIDFLHSHTPSTYTPSVEVIDNDTLVGLNICNLYLSDRFISLFKNVSIEKNNVYYISQHTKPLFKGHTLLEYLKSSLNGDSSHSNALAYGSMLFKEKMPHMTVEEHIQLLQRESLEILDQYYQNKK